MLGSLAALRGVPSDENQYQKAIDNFSLSILILCFFAVLVLAQIYGRRPRPKPPPDGSADVQDVLPG
jgi:hypothetical protein